MLFTNAFPRNAERVYHQRRLLGLRALIGLLFAPPFMLAYALSTGRKRLLAECYGGLLLLLLAPILIYRLVAARRRTREILRDFAPATRGA